MTKVPRLILVVVNLLLLVLGSGLLATSIVVQHSSNFVLRFHPQQNESLFNFQGCIHQSVFFNGGMIFMHVYKHWLDHDVAALAFLIVGIAAVELLAIII